jgi:NAD-reducing hydrogenase large subunit
VRADGAMDLYDGKLRAIDAQGKTIFDHMDYRKFDDYIMEEVKPWSYMKFPFIRSQGQEEGWYRVGPLARMNTVDFIDTPLANKRHQEFKEFFGKQPAQMTLAYHWARMIEVLHCAEMIKKLLLDSDLQGTDLLLKGERREEGISVIEAPRGSLFHHYKVNENDQVTYCNLIVSTTHNNTAMNRAVTDVAKTYLSGQKKITEPMMNHIEVAIRAYDPCLSCATHALGKMPLKVEIYNAEEKLIDSASQFVTIPK